MPRETHNSIIYDTVTRALASCGLAIKDIDVVVDSGSDFLDGRGISNVITVDAMGAHFKEESKVAGDGLLAAIYAYMRIATGLFDTALVVAYGKSSESDPAAQSRTMAEPFYTRPLGLDGLAAAALQAQAYRQHYGVAHDATARVAVKNRAAGSRNPHAQLRDPVSLDEVLHSRELVAPIRRLEAAPSSDGACAVVLAEGSAARSLRVRRAWIAGLGQGTTPYSLGARRLHRADAAEQAAKAACERAGIVDRMAELDVAEVSEYYAYQELMLYEAMGFCGQGEGADLLQAMENGEGPTVNPSGGVLCADPQVATGLVRLAEAAAQVSGRAGGLQVENAGKAIAHAGGGFAMQSAAAMIVES